jgi:hypothetical protein
MPPRIVLDKSFLQSVSARRVLELHASNCLVMTDSLFYELITTDAKARARCFAKFPQIENPVRLVSHIGPMLLHEQRTKTKACDFLDYEIKQRFKFNPCLQNTDYNLPPESEQSTKEETDYVSKSIVRYIERTSVAIDFFPMVTEGSDEARRLALEKYEAAIAIPENIIKIYEIIDDKNLPAHSMLTAEWATFRFFQVNLLFSLHTLHRHRGPIPSPASSREITKLEHDVHDANLLVTAIMAGGFATKERKLQHWWRLLASDKSLYTS